MRPTGPRARAIWLSLLGIIVALVAVASLTPGSTIAPAVGFAVVVAYAALFLLSVINIDLSSVGRRVQPLTASARMTPVGRAAWQKARTRPDFGMGGDDTLVDIGFLINERRRDGTWNRRVGTTATFDDGALQPFVKLYVAPDHANRMVLVEFEFFDRNGRVQFSHHMEEYLRDGENLLLCDRQLTLRENEDRGRAGIWDMRVKVDGNLMGIHEFNMSASDEDRRREIDRDGEVSSRRLAASEDDAVPVSLEDLLREQARRNNSARG